MDTFWQGRPLGQSQVIQLARLFFARFFDNDLLNPGVDRSNTVFTVLAAIATPSAFLPLLFLPKYVIMLGSHYYIHLTDVSWFIALAIALMAVATTLEWEAFFPDRRDCLILTPLPVSQAAFIGAKILALITFLAVLAIASDGIASVFFPIVSTTSHTFSPVIHQIASHGATVVLASIFTFAAVVALQSVCMVLLSYRAFRRLLPALQIALLIATFLMLTSLPKALGILMQPGFPGIERHFFLPPLWFLGVHQRLLGDPLPLWKELNLIALNATWIAVVTCVITYALAARKYLCGSIEAMDETEQEPSWVRLRIDRAINHCLLRDPTERATFHFTTKTILRSPRHRLILATTLAGAALAIVSALPSLATVDTSLGFSEVSKTALSMPFIVVLIGAIGVRYSFSVPAELQSNWLFRLTAGEDLARVLRGLRKTMIVVGLLPGIVGLFALQAFFFGAGAAAASTLFVLAFGVVVLETTLVGFAKLPFTCSYRSGKANLRVMWLFYLLAFVATVSIAVASERWAWANTGNTVVSFISFFVLHQGIAWFGRRQCQRAGGIIFEEVDDEKTQVLMQASD